MPRLTVNNYMLAGRNADFEVAPTFTAATSTGARWIDGSAAGIAASDSAYKWAIISGTTANTFAAQFDNSEKYDGTNSMKLSLGAVGSSLEVGPMTSIAVGGLIRTGIPCAGSTAYTAKFWMKTTYTSGDSNDGAFVNINERTVAAGGSVNNTSTKIKTTTDWTQYTIQFTTAAATRFLIPRLALAGVSGTGTLIMTAWFDKLELYPTTPITRTAVS